MFGPEVVLVKSGKEEGGGSREWLEKMYAVTYCKWGWGGD